MLFKVSQYLTRLLSIVIAILLTSCFNQPTSSDLSIKISSKSIQSLTFPAGVQICFGVDISADDIDAQEATNCSPKLSTHAGFVANNGEISLQVSAGEARQVDLYAYVTDIGAVPAPCPAWDANIDYSNVYRVGGTPEPVDMFDEEVVLEILASFPGAGNDLQSQLNLFSCSDSGNIDTSPTINNVSIGSDNTYSDMATNGNTISINFDSDVAMGDLSVRILGQSATIAPAGGNSYIAQLTLAGGALAEGIVNFDIADNLNGTAQTTTDDGSQVIYDRTAPFAPSSANVVGAKVDTNGAPVVTIGGVEAAASVELFLNDPTCASVNAGQAVATSNSVSITPMPGVLPGMNQIYARQTDRAGNVSACSSVYADYYLASTTPLVSGWSQNAGGSITIPVVAGGTYNLFVDWGDGSPIAHITSEADVDKTHMFATANTNRIIRIGGLADRLAFDNGTNPNGLNRDQLINVFELGDLGWTDFTDMFYGCSNLVSVSGGVTNGVISMERMFSNATSLNNLDVSNWNTSAVTNMQLMFFQATNFNSNLSALDTSSVIDMLGMFQSATLFNQPLNAWDVSNVTTMANMFRGAQNFNGNITSWDTSNVTSMREMFMGATAFNQDIGLWDVSNVSDMAFMFQAAQTFNQDISGWMVSNVATMAGMFDGAHAFNQPIGTWATMTFNVFSMSRMFREAYAFDQDLSSWNTSSVTDMSEMFDNATAFNGNVTGWDTSGVTSMQRMFFGAVAFDQDISSWMFTNVNDMTDFFGGATSFSMAHYDALLMSLDSQYGTPGLVNGVTFGANGLTYSISTAGAARGNLTNAGLANWTIIGDSGI